LPGAIQHIFVLMLENRSFDHMLGFSGIKGTDAQSGGATEIMGLIDLSLLQLARSQGVNTASGMVRRKGQPWPPPPAISIRDLFTSNQFNGQTYRVTQPADFAMPADPCHEFECVVDQLCGPGVQYHPGGSYPPITNSGFVDSYVENTAIAQDSATEAALASANPGEIMKAYSPWQLPVLIALCEEFVVCDNWFSSLPGPTWPNRFFAHAASSGGLDHSPSSGDVVKWETVDGFDFANGTIFDALNNNNIPWRIYAGDNFPVVAGLKGINLTDIRDYSDFGPDVSQANYPASYTFIEPSYDEFSEYRCGTSQHPLGDVTRGEGLIKATYESIRNSPIWSSSLLVVTWDEHGGFFDHIAPPPAVPPGDTALDDDNTQHGFTFAQYGPRVAAIVMSPLIPKNLIDHRLYDHSSIPATLEACFGFGPLTQRDAAANNLMLLVSLQSPRGDARATLPAPVASDAGGCGPATFLTKAGAVQSPVSRPSDPADAGNGPGFLHVALRMELQLSPPTERDQVLARFNAVKTRADAIAYLDHVSQLIQAKG
jgi:phospholipase C